ncbi:MAG: hypothetical protein ABFC31_04820 [Clostridiaceae bacterium]
MKKVPVSQFIIEFLTTNNSQMGGEDSSAFLATYELFGSQSEFHNVSAEFARANQYQLACHVLDCGLSLYPNDTDLLADYLEYGVRCGKEERAKECYDKLEEIPKELYTWRSFTFMIDYILYCYTANMFSHKVDVKSACDAVISDYKKFLPLQEKAYMAEYEVAKTFGASDEDLLEILKAAIAKIKVAPQLCMRFVDKSLELGNYDDVIFYSRRGLSAAAQEQESVDTGYFYYAMALAMDAKWYDDKDEKFGDIEYAKDIIKKYRAADASLDGNKDTYRKLLKKRVNMIATEIGIDLPY